MRMYILPSNGGRGAAAAGDLAPTLPPNSHKQGSFGKFEDLIPSEIREVRSGEENGGFWQTRSSNTGLKCHPEKPDGSSDGQTQGSITVKCDYLVGVAVTDTLDELHRLFEFCCSFTRVPEDYVVTGQPIGSGIVWDNHARSLLGGIFAWRHEEGKDNRPDYWRGWVSLPGKFMSAMTLRNQYRLFRGLYHHWGFKSNRFDGAGDDYGYRDRITPAQLNVILETFDDILPNGKLYGGVFEYCRKHCKRFWTLYLGSKKSDLFHRFYDATKIHGIDAMRWELQARDEKAHIIFQSLANLEFDHLDEKDFLCQFSRELGQYIVGSVDFRQREGSKRYSRCKRFEWWQSLIDAIEFAEYPSLPKIRPSFMRALEWFWQGVACKAGVLKKVFGSVRYRRLMDDIADEGIRRFSTRHDLEVTLGRLWLRYGIDEELVSQEDLQLITRLGILEDIL